MGHPGCGAAREEHLDSFFCCVILPRVPTSLFQGIEDLRTWTLGRTWARIGFWRCQVFLVNLRNSFSLHLLCTFSSDAEARFCRHTGSRLKKCNMKESLERSLHQKSPLRPSMVPCFRPWEAAWWGEHRWGSQVMAQGPELPLPALRAWLISFHLRPHK